MAGSLGEASFALWADAAELIRAMDASAAKVKATTAKIAQDLGVSEQSVTKAANKMAAEQDKIDKANAKAAGSFAGLTKSAIGFGVAAVGIGSAVDVARKSIDSIVESTKAAQQAQFALSKTYGSGTAEMTAFSKGFADQIGRSNTDVAKAAVLVGNLTREYGLSAGQAQNLIRISADLAAKFGTDLPEATKRLQAAIRGEAESAEELGLVLNDDAVATRQLGIEGQKLWQHLTDQEKAQLRLAEATRQLGEAQGAAAERAKGPMGAFDRLGKVTDELGAALGTRLLPVVALVADELATMGTGALEALDALNDLSNLDTNRLMQIASLLFNPAGVVAARWAGLQLPWDKADKAKKDAADAATAEKKAVAEAETARRVAQIKANAEERANLDRRKKAADDILDIQQDRIKTEQQAADTAYEADKRRLEAQKADVLEAFEVRKKATLAALEEEEAARKSAADAEHTRLQVERDDKLKATDATHTATMRALEVEHQATKDAADENIRQLEIERDHRKQAAEDTRDDVIRALDAEKRVRDANRVQEDRAEEDATKATIKRIENAHAAAVKGFEKEQKAAEDASRKKLRALDQEGDKARKKSDADVRNIEKQADLEDERHRKAIANIDAERSRRLKEIDDQTKALDAAARAEDNAGKITEAQANVAAAQQGLAQAMPSGTPEQQAAARAKLTAAIRIKDVEAEAKARAELVAISGHGDAAILAAREALAEAEAALRKESVDQARDAERTKLTAAKDAIGNELDARKDAEDEQNRQRKASLDADKQAEQDKLKSALDRIEKRKQATQDATRDEIEQIHKRSSAEQDANTTRVELAQSEAERRKRAVADVRTAEDQADQDRRRQAQDEYEDTQRLLKATYDDEETGSIPRSRRAVDAADRDYAERRRVAEASFKGEQDAIRDTYDHPETGLIARQKAASDAAGAEYSRRRAIAESAFAAEQKAINDTYTNSQHTGLLDRLADQKAATDKAIDADLLSWERWKKGILADIEAAEKRLTAFQEAQKRVPGGIGPPDPGGNTPNIDEGAAEKFIRNTFSSAGIPAADALSVWAGEGKSDYVGDEGSSFGPYQLHYGGISKKSPGPGLGDQFTKETGLDARDPNTWMDQIYWVVDYVKRHGWNNQWHGAPAKIADKRYAEGGWIAEPVVGRGLWSGASYSFAEQEREMVTPASRMAAVSRSVMTDPVVTLSCTAGGRVPTYANSTAQTASMLRGGGSGGNLARDIARELAPLVGRSTVNFNGLTYEKAMDKHDQLQRRRAREHQNLRGMK